MNSVNDSPFHVRDDVTPLVEMQKLSKHFESDRLLELRPVPPVRAVDEVDLMIHRGETFGLVGESGCGKSTLGLLLMGLLQPTSGNIYFSGQDISTDSQSLKTKTQMIFQDPYSSLNPSFRVRNILWEAYRQREQLDRSQKEQDFLRSMEQVGLHGEILNFYPHQLSGGQRQRVMIARALLLNPEFIVMDEPTSALDVSVQAQILNLLIDLQKRMGLTYLFISHDISAIRYMSDRIAVMYLGRIVEKGPAKSVLNNPRHPYTDGLLASIPKPEERQGRSRSVVVGDIPNPKDIPKGCRFHPRCPNARPKCETIEPQLKHEGWARQIACFFPVGE